jgi:hypothetical protein
MNHSVDRFWQRFRDLTDFKMPLAEKQALARQVRERDGVEVTPDEAEFTLAKALATIRRTMIDAGYREFESMTIFEVRDVVRSMG